QAWAVLSCLFYGSPSRVRLVQPGHVEGRTSSEKSQQPEAECNSHDTLEPTNMIDQIIGQGGAHVNGWQSNQRAVNQGSRQWPTLTSRRFLYPSHQSQRLHCIFRPCYHSMNHPTPQSVIDHSYAYDF